MPGHHDLGHVARTRQSASRLTTSALCRAGNQNTEDEAHAQIDAFLGGGGNFIDTAELYPVPPDAKTSGRTEEIIGRYLEKNADARSRLVIATKVAGPMPVNFVVAAREKALTGKADAAAPLPRLVPEQIERALAASLVRPSSSLAL